MPRPPHQTAASSPYITKAGFAALQEEEKAIWKKRAAVTRALAAAAAEGDRSENAEYIYRKKELREIDRRIRYLQTRLPALNVVGEVGDRAKIFFGAWVTLTKAGGGGVTYRIVGGDEIKSDSSQGYISVDSPMARAMLGKSVGESVELELNGERKSFRVKKIRYD